MAEVTGEMQPHQIAGCVGIRIESDEKTVQGGVVFIDVHHHARLHQYLHVARGDTRTAGAPQVVEFPEQATIRVEQPNALGERLVRDRRPDDPLDLVLEFVHTARDPRLGPRIVHRAGELREVHRFLRPRPADHVDGAEELHAVIGGDEAVEDVEFTDCGLIGDAPRVAAVELGKQVAALRDRGAAFLDDHRQRTGGVHDLGRKVHRKGTDHAVSVLRFPCLRVSDRVIGRRSQRRHDGRIQFVHIQPFDLVDGYTAATDELRRGDLT